MDVGTDGLDHADRLVAHASAGLDRLHQLVRPEIAAADAGAADGDERVSRLDQAGVGDVLDADISGAVQDGCSHRDLPLRIHIDRKSTRLNSSHSQISYAVFCLKKKKKS